MFRLMGRTNCIFSDPVYRLLDICHISIEARVYLAVQAVPSGPQDVVCILNQLRIPTFGANGLRLV
jgi:hypothetical protein